MERWTFYSAPGTCALATHIALHEAGAAFDAVTVDFTTEQQRSADYLAINPRGRVPALVTPGGVLTENPALLLFVAQSFPEAALAPLDDPLTLARMQEMNSYLASTVHVAHAHKRRGSRWADDPAAHESMRAKVPESMTACAVTMEAMLGPGPWVLGQRYSVADAYLYTVCRWLAGDGVAVDRFPRLMDHQARMAQRPAVQRALSGAGS